MPWFFFMLIFGLPLAGMIYSYFSERLKSQERMKAMEKGTSIPPSLPGANPRSVLAQKTPWERADDLRLAGLICIAVGVGLALLLGGLAWSLPDVPKGVSAIGAIPALVGAVLLYESRRRTRELGPRPPATEKN